MAAKLIPIPEVAAAQFAANAVTKAGAAVRKPAWTRKKRLEYDAEIERGGEIVKAHITEEHGGEIGTVGVALLGLAVAVTAAGVIGAVSATSSRLRKKKENANG
jgi:hypothetical protein